MKKHYSRIFAALMAVGLLASCEGGNQSASVGEKPTLKILMNNITADPNTYPVAKMLEEKTGYKVQYDLLPSDNVEEKLNLILSSQEEYDGIQILSKYREKFVDYAKQGALTELDELAEKYGVNMKTCFTNKTWDAGRVDGKLYGIVTCSARKTEVTESGEIIERPSGMGTMLLVRTDIMKKAGIEKIPETIDEFTDMLRAMKKLSSNSMQSAPLTTTSDLALPGITGAFGIECTWIESGDGTLVNQIETEGYKEYLLYLKSLYDEGLLDSELPTNKTNNTQEKFTSGKSYVMPMAYYDAATIMDALEKNAPDYEVEYMFPLEGANGQRGYAYGSNPLERVMVIPKSAEHPDDMMKWIDAKLDADVFRNLAIGEEGVHFEIRDGAYYPINPKFSDERALANDFLSGIDEFNYFDYWLARVRKDERIYQKYLDSNAETVLAAAHKNPEADAPVMTASKYKTTLDTIVNDFALGVITGADSIDNYDSFLAKWKANGGEEWENELNEWYTKTN